MMYLSPFQYRLVRALEQDYIKKIFEGKKPSLDDCDGLAEELGLSVQQRDQVKNYLKSYFENGQTLDSQDYSVQTAPDDLWRDLANGLKKYCNVSLKEKVEDRQYSSNKIKRLKYDGDILTCEDSLEDMIQSTSFPLILQSCPKIEDKYGFYTKALENCIKLGQELEWPMDYSYCQLQYSEVFNGQQFKHNIGAKTPVFFYRFIDPSSFIISGNGVSYYEDNCLHSISWENLKLVDFNPILRHFKFVSFQESDSFSISAYNLLKFYDEKSGFATLLTSFVEDWREYVAPVIKKREIIAEELKTIVSVPVNVRVFVEDGYCVKLSSAILEKYKDIYVEYCNSTNGSERWRILKKQLTDIRLNAFYQISIRCESEKNIFFFKLYEDKRLLAEFERRPNILRQEYIPFVNYYYPISCTDDEFKERIESSMQFVEQHNDTLAKYKNDTSLSDIQERTKKLICAANRFAEVAQSLSLYCKTINTDLLYARLRAYQNVFLGVELANFIGIKGGNKIGVIDESIETVSSESFSLVNVENAYLEFDVLSSIYSSLAIINQTLNEMLTNGNSATNSVGKGIFKIAASLLSEYSQTIGNNMKIQKQAITIMETASKSIIEYGSKAIRSIEIVDALKKADEGFWAIYEPLRNKVFKYPYDYEPNAQECYTFMNAICAYNKITQSQL